MPYSKGKRYTKDLKYDIKVRKERSIKKQSKSIDKFLYSFIILFLLYFGYFIFFSEKNIFNLAKKIQYKEDLVKENSKLKEEIESLKKKKIYLKSDITYIEKRAREDLGLTKNGEIIFIVPEEEVKKEVKKQEEGKRWIKRIVEQFKEKEIKN